MSEENKAKGEMGSRPLEGVKILDLSRLLPGPLASMMLADLGAEVIKIEHPDKPDYVRHFPPFIGKQSAFYLSLNRSKKSLSLNTDTAEGKELFFKLIAQSDIVLDQFRPGVLDKMGIGYETAKKINPKIIYVSITGYGQTGSFSQKAGHDLNYIAQSGILSQISNNNKIPAIQLADIAGGSYMAVNACLTALLSRNISGIGQHVDVAMMDGVMPLLTMNYAHFAGNQLAGKNQTPFLLDGSMPNYAVYVCGDDRKVALGALEPKFWMRFCDVIGKQEWKTANFFDTDSAKKIKEELSVIFLTKTRDEWVELTEMADCCLSPVLDLHELKDNPHIKERGMIIEQITDEGEQFLSIGQAVKYSTLSAENKPAPKLGEHTTEILKTIGLNDDDIQSLRDKKIVK